jgi:hypothetical protein
MARFIVRFLKDVLGENGHETEVCQSYLEVEAANPTEAVELAKTKFCEKEILADWSLHADRVQVAEAEFPS